MVPTRSPLDRQPRIHRHAGNSDQQDSPPARCSPVAAHGDAGAIRSSSAQCEGSFLLDAGHAAPRKSAARSRRDRSSAASLADSAGLGRSGGCSATAAASCCSSPRRNRPAPDSPRRGVRRPSNMDRAARPLCAAIGNVISGSTWMSESGSGSPSAGAKRRHAISCRPPPGRCPRPGDRSHAASPAYCRHPAQG